MATIEGAVHNGGGQPRTTKDGLRKLGLTADGSIFSATYLDALAREGRIFIGGDSTLIETITSAVTYATTSPTLLLKVPSNTTALPLYLNLAQTGTVGGGEITIHIEIDNVDRYTSGGTAETVLSSRTDAPTGVQSTIYSNSGSAILATNAYGMGLWHGEFIQDVDPAVADDFQWHNWVWQPHFPIYLVGAATFIVNIVAATTGATYYWNFAWAEIPSSEL